MVCYATHFFTAITPATFTGGRTGVFVIEGEVRLIFVGLWPDVLVRVSFVLVVVSAIFVSFAMISIVGIITTSIKLVCVSAVANIVVVDVGVGVFAITVVRSVPVVGVLKSVLFVMVIAIFIVGGVRIVFFPSLSIVVSCLHALFVYSSSFGWLDRSGTAFRPIPPLFISGVRMQRIAELSAIV